MLEGGGGGGGGEVEEGGGGGGEGSETGSLVLLAGTSSSSVIGGGSGLGMNCLFALLCLPKTLGVPACMDISKLFTVEGGERVCLERVSLEKRVWFVCLRLSVRRVLAHCYR